MSVIWQVNICKNDRVGVACWQVSAISVTYEEGFFNIENRTLLKGSDYSPCMLLARFSFISSYCKAFCEIVFQKEMQRFLKSREILSKYL